MSPIKVQVQIKAGVEKVWNYFTDPSHITKWNFASDDWACPKAQNDFKVHGGFNFRMEAKDGSFGFDLRGTYTEVVQNKYIAYMLEDARKVTVTFTEEDGETTVVETFEPEMVNPNEMQQAGWQAILNNFKKHVETA